MGFVRISNRAKKSNGDNQIDRRVGAASGVSEVAYDAGSLAGLAQMNHALARPRLDSHERALGLNRD